MQRGTQRWVWALACTFIVTFGRFADATLSATLGGVVQQGAPVKSGVFDVLTPLVRSFSIRGTDLPPTASSLGFVFRFDLESGAYVRDVSPLGSIFVEPPQTVGKGMLALGAAYQHAELDTFEGNDLAEQVTLRSSLSTSAETIDVTLRFQRLAVETDVVSLFGTYGITDRWDVSVLVPVRRTSIDVRAERIRRVTRDVPVSVSRQAIAASDDATGVGDVLLRTKWQGRLKSLDLSLGLTVRGPSGNEDNFDGLGDWTVQPTLILGRSFGAYEVHANAGMELNTDDIERTRARYGIGMSLQPLRGFALVLDVLGSSSFVEDGFEITSPNSIPVHSTFLQEFQSGPIRPTPAGYSRQASIPRTDLVDLGTGIKWNPASSAFVFVGALVPLTDDGLRPDVIPAAAVQVLF